MVRQWLMSDDGDVGEMCRRQIAGMIYEDIEEKRAEWLAWFAEVQARQRCLPVIVDRRDTVYREEV